MRNYVLIQLLVLLGVLSGQQAIVTSGVQGTIVLPSTAPYTSITDTRIEFRLTGISTCRDSSTGSANNILNLSPVFEFGCVQLGTQSFTVGTGSPTTTPHITAIDLAGNTDV